MQFNVAFEVLSEEKELITMCFACAVKEAVQNPEANVVITSYEDSVQCDRCCGWIENNIRI